MYMNTCMGMSDRQTDLIMCGSSERIISWRESPSQTSAANAMRVHPITARSAIKVIKPAQIARRPPIVGASFMRTRAGIAAVDIIRAQNVKSLAPNSKPSIPNATVLIGWLRQTRGHAASS